MNKFLGAMLLVAIPIVLYLFIEDGRFSMNGLLVSGSHVISIGEVPVRVEVASTALTRTRGLSGRESLPPTEGLLLVFDESGYHGIWMKEMEFPIDIIWVDETLRVVDIRKNVSPHTYPRTFEPRRPARFVVEVNANYAESFGIKIGDVVKLPRKITPQDLLEY